MSFDPPPGMGITGLGESRQDDRIIVNSESLSPRVTYRKAIEIEPREIEWVWQQRIPRGMLTIIAGPGKIGKDTVCQSIAAHVTKGSPFFDTPEVSVEPENVAFLACEDPLEFVQVPRLIAANANLDRVFFPNGLQKTASTDAVGLNLSIHVPYLEEFVRENEIRVLFINPLNNYVGAEVDSNADTSVREFLRPIVSLAEDTNTAIVAIMHHNKSASSAANQTIGSVAYRNVARVNLTVAKDPMDNDRRFLLDNGSNLGREIPGAAFRIEEDCKGTGYAVWTETVDLNAEQVLTSSRNSNDGELLECMNWLAEFLGSTEVSVKDVHAASDAEGFSRATLKRAKSELKIISQKPGFEDGWTWKLRG